MRCQGCSLPSINAWPRMLGDAVGCVMVRAEVGPLDVQKLKLRAPRAGAVKRARHKAGCGCTGRHSRSCRRAAAWHRHPYGAEAAWAARCQYHDDLHARSNSPAEACAVRSMIWWPLAIAGELQLVAARRHSMRAPTAPSAHAASVSDGWRIRSRSAHPGQKRAAREGRVQAPMHLVGRRSGHRAVPQAQLFSARRRSGGGLLDIRLGALYFMNWKFVTGQWPERAGSFVASLTRVPSGGPMSTRYPSGAYLQALQAAIAAAAGQIEAMFAAAG
jgi:hypothetical protein